MLIDATFVQALIEATNENHDDALQIYRELVEQFRVEEVRLMAQKSVLDEATDEIRSKLLAPVEVLRISARHRRAAAMATPRVSPETALTLAIAAHDRIRTIASFDPELAYFDINILSAQGVSARTEPLFESSETDASAL